VGAASRRKCNAGRHEVIGRASTVQHYAVARVRRVFEIWTRQGRSGAGLSVQFASTRTRVQTQDKFKEQQFVSTGLE
jgi:hypothetical protein